MDHIRIPNDTLTGQLFLSSKESALDIKLLEINQIKLVVSVCESESKSEKELLHSQRIGYKWKEMKDKDEYEENHMTTDEILHTFEYIHSIHPFNCFQNTKPGSKCVGALSIGFVVLSFMFRCVFQCHVFLFSLFVVRD